MARNELKGPPGRLGALATRVIERMPGGSLVQEQVQKIEQRLLLELKQRLDRIEDRTSVPSSVSVLAVQVNQTTAGPEAVTQDPATHMRSLLDISSTQSREDASRAAATAILRMLLPDEARILSALSDGAAYPMIHVFAGPKLGFASNPMIEYVSTVGRASGVMAPEWTGFYVRRLSMWGLTETGPEEYKRTVDYQILETDDAVRRVVARVQKNGERTRIDRRMLRISELGRTLWTLCAITEAADVSMSDFRHE